MACLGLRVLFKNDRNPRIEPRAILNLASASNRFAIKCHHPSFSPQVLAVDFGRLGHHGTERAKIVAKTRAARPPTSRARRPIIVTKFASRCNLVVCPPDDNSQSILCQLKVLRGPSLRPRRRPRREVSCYFASGKKKDEDTPSL